MERKMEPEFHIHVEGEKTLKERFAETNALRAWICREIKEELLGESLIPEGCLEVRAWEEQDV